MTAQNVTVSITLEDGLSKTVITKSAPAMPQMEGALLADAIELARRDLRIEEPWSFGMEPDE